MVIKIFDHHPFVPSSQEGRLKKRLLRKCTTGLATKCTTVDHKVQGGCAESDQRLLRKCTTQNK